MENYAKYRSRLKSEVNRIDACAFSSIISISSPSTFSAVVSVLFAAFRVKSYRKLCRLWNEFRKARVNGIACSVGLVCSFFVAAAELNMLFTGVL